MEPLGTHNVQSSAKSCRLLCSLLLLLLELMFLLLVLPLLLQPPLVLLPLLRAAAISTSHTSLLVRVRYPCSYCH